MARNLKFLILFLIVYTLYACAGSSANVPVMERSGLRLKPPNYHVVKRGETLYSIAWRYGIDYRSIARTNNIGAPYRIQHGQKLDLTSSSGASKKSLVKKPDTTSTSRSAPQVAAKKALSNVTNRVSTALGIASEDWRWPSKGRLIKGFSKKGQVNKGIDIGGNLGDAVTCARGGRVVYAGSGLTGYGKLIIVKHDQNYLSAYAHSSKILVTEGDVVRAGQKIAEMGASGTNRIMLHFEIRKDGKPMNPQKLLPER
jgi:lipoprotein NlpD